MNFPSPNFPFVFLLLLILHPALAITDSTQGAPPSKYEIPALGRRAQLGEFYDEITQSFSGVPVFKDQIPWELINTTDISRTSIEYTKRDTFEEKSQLTKLSLDLAMSILFDLINIRGSAEYMKEEKASNNSVAVFMDYQMRTITESIQPLHDNIQGFISKQFLHSIKATHIVIGIEYGADVVVKFEDKNEEQESIERVMDSLLVAVQDLAELFSASGSASTSVTPSYKNKGSNLFIKLFGDVSYGSDTPMNFDQLQDFIRIVPSLVQKTNNGKGYPMSYILLPLDILREKLQVNVPTRLVTQVDSAILRDLIHIPSRIHFVKQGVNDLVTAFRNNEKCLPRVHMKQLVTLRDKFVLNTNKFKDQVKRLTLAIRGGQVPLELVKVKEDFLSGEFSPDQVAESLSTQFTPAQEKIRLCRTLIEATQNRGPVEYFSNSAFLISFHFKHTGKNVFILYYSLDFINQNKTAWLEKRSRFFQLAQSPVNKMAVMDCDFLNANCPSQNIKNVTLVHFKNGRKKGEVTASAIYKFPRNAQIVEIPALGTTEKLGALFSEKTRKFMRTSVLNVDTPFVEYEPTMGMHQTFLFPRQTPLDKLRALNIPPELQLSILTGTSNFIPSSGSISRYLREGQTSYGGLVSRIRTMKESVNISSSAFQNNLNLDRAVESGATHYIHSIFYGATAIFQTPVQITGEMGEVEGDLQTISAMFKNIFHRDKNESCTTANSMDEEKLKSKSIITFMSDIPAMNDQKMGPGGDITWHVKDTIQSFFQSLAGENEGKGVPVAYVLHPLHSLDDQIDTLGAPEDSSSPAPTNQLDFLQHFENLQLAEDSLLEFQSNYSSPKSKMCAFSTINNEISNFIKEFAHNKTLWIERVKSALRLPNPTSSVLQQLSYEAEEKFTAANVIREAKMLLRSKFNGQLIKMQMCEWAESVGVFYLGLSEYSSLDEVFLSREPNKDVYLLFVKEKWTRGHLWIKTLYIFSRLNLPSHRLFLVDCDVSPRLKQYCDKLSKQEPTILQYTNGTLTAEIS